MATPLKLRAEKKAKTAARRPKSVAVKTVSTEAGGKRRLFILDANSQTFGEDFLYVFANSVRAARRATRAVRARAQQGVKNPTG